MDGESASRFFAPKRLGACACRKNIKTRNTVLKTASNGLTIKRPYLGGSNVLADKEENITLPYVADTYLAPHEAAVKLAPEGRLAYKKKRTYKFVNHQTIKRKLKVATCKPRGLLFFNNYMSVTVLDGQTIEVSIFNGYAWDGNSGGFTTKNWLIPSLFHDAGYQLMREGVLARYCRKDFDWAMYDLCLEEGMWKFRAGYSFVVVRVAGARYTKPDLLAA